MHISIRASSLLVRLRDEGLEQVAGEERNLKALIDWKPKLNI